MNRRHNEPETISAELAQIGLAVEATLSATGGEDCRVRRRKWPSSHGSETPCPLTTERMPWKPVNFIAAV